MPNNPKDNQLGESAEQTLNVDPSTVECEWYGRRVGINHHLVDTVDGYRRCGSCKKVFTGVAPIAAGTGTEPNDFRDGLGSNSAAMDNALCDRDHTEEGLNPRHPSPTERCGNSNHGWKARMTCMLPKGHTGNHEDSTRCWWR